MTPSDYYERYCNWYKLTLCKIANADDQANPIHLKELAQAALDVDSAELKIWVTESEELKSKGIYSSRHHGVKDAEYSLGIDDVKIDLKDKSREKKINMIQSIGYRGEE
jgi:hypothetical protein